LVLLSGIVQAADWPEWRGRGRLGVWEEDGILEQFPAGGLRVRWRAPVRAGYAGPAVGGGRVFVTDYSAGTERLVCLDARTGRTLWTVEWAADYKGLDYASGPRATPTVDGDRAYALGAVGALRAVDIRTGTLRWKKDFRSDFSAALPPWGFACAPLVDGDRLIAVVAGRPEAMVVAFDKRTGRELWRALSSDTEPGYSQPVIIRAGGTRQLIVWHAAAVSSLDPATGRLYWEHPFKIHMSTPIATPLQRGPWLLVSAFFQGSRMFRLAEDRPAADLVWRGMSDSEVKSDGLHALLGTPVIDGDYIYGTCSYGQLRCLKLSTGERVWETQEVTREKARNTSAHIVRHKDRYFIQNDRGELIIARLTPERYIEIDRTKLIEPTSAPGARRELKAVNWSHPAFADRHVFARNDREIICASLEAGLTRSAEQ
jgi:outer membrane protein assembly factor BamB